MIELPIGFRVSGCLAAQQTKHPIIGSGAFASQEQMRSVKREQQAHAYNTRSNFVTPS